MTMNIPSPAESSIIGEAEAQARLALAADSENPLTWHSLAFVLIEAGKLVQARDCLSQVVALDPVSIMARNNHGVVLHRLGEAQRACEAYQGALALDPDNAAAHNNLACVLSELGRFESSLDHARRAVARDPGQLGAYVYAAIAEANLDRKDAALAWLDAALATSPTSVRVMIERAELLRVLDRAEEGLEICRQAIELEPDNAKAHNSLGLLHQTLGCDEEALAAFDHAIRLTPQPARAYANKAIVLLELGRREAALASLDLALAADPALAAAWFIRSDLKTFTPADPDITAMEHILAQGPQPQHERTLLHFALGKAYLDTRDAAKAFGHLGRGGRLKRATLAYDAERAREQMAAIADAFPAELFARSRGAGDSSQTPIFIVGIPRSGGTLIEQILASHPQIQAGGEARHIEALIGQLGEAYPGGVSALPHDRIAALGSDYLAMAAPRPGAARITDKAANHFLHLGLIHLALPGARIIHCRRDPIDTCLSCYSKLFASGQEFSYDLAELGGYHRLYAGLMDHWRKTLAADRFIEVDYEAVVDDLEAQARRMIAFCGLDWDDACLRFYETDRPIRTASLNHVRKTLYRTSLGRWTSFRDQLGPLLAALGE